MNYGFYRSIIAASIFVFVISLISIDTAAQPRSLNLILPDDANIVDVKRDFGAVGDGVADDSESIYRAILSTVTERTRYGKPKFVYLPEGTYRVTRPIEVRNEDGNWWSGMLLMGAGVDRVTIKLDDNAPEFADPERPRGIIVTGSEIMQKETNPRKDISPEGLRWGNQAFRHSLMNLTIDVGAGNPGAIGIDYLANNRGTIRNVRLIAADQSGYAGISMEQRWPGPCLITHVEITGFDTGIKVDQAQYGITFDSVNLTGQRSVGILNTDNVLCFYNLNADLDGVPVYRGTGRNGLLVAIKGHWLGRGATAAVDSKHKLYLDRVHVGGYQYALVDQTENASQPHRVRVESGGDEISYSAEVYRLGSSSDIPSLPIKDAPPTFYSTNSDDWANVEDYGAKADDDQDDADGIQAAIDSGKPIVYLPNGFYRVSRPVILRGNVRTFMGMQSLIRPHGPLPPRRTLNKDVLVRFEGEAGRHITMEHLWVRGIIEHAGAGTLVTRHMDLAAGYQNTSTGTGDYFGEDIVGFNREGSMRFLYPQNAWFRQLDREFAPDPLIENHGANLWIFGFKTEGHIVCYEQHGGRSEIHGAFLYPVRGRNPEGPAMVIHDGTFRGSIAMNDKGYRHFIGLSRDYGYRTISRQDIGRRVGTLISVDANETIDGQ